MYRLFKRRRIDPPAREAPGGDVDDSAPGGGGPGLVSMALFQKQEELLKATRSELAQTKEQLAAAKATIAEYAEMHPTFDVNEDVASVRQRGRRWRRRRSPRENCEGAQLARRLVSAGA